MEGSVSSETRSELVLDIGYGTVTLRKADIQKVRRSSKGERKAGLLELRRRQFESGRRAPKEATRLDELFRSAQSGRGKAFEARARRAGLEESARSSRKDLADQKERYRSALERMRGFDAASDPTGYNRLVAEVNGIAAQMAADSLRIQDALEKGREGDAAAQDYLSAFYRIRDYLQGEEGRRLGLRAVGWEADYYSWVRDEVRKMRKDFDEESIKSERHGDGILVQATLNGRVQARLLVDTGASLTVVYQPLADALGLGPGEAMGVVKVRVADGRQMEAAAFRLDSISVGKSEVQGSIVAVVDSENPDCDGLLGMSFLRHFVFKVDSANGLLILDRLK